MELSSAQNCRYYTRQIDQAKSQKESTFFYDKDGKLIIETCELLQPNTAKNSVAHFDDKLFHGTRDSTTGESKGENSSESKQSSMTQPISRIL